MRLGTEPPACGLNITLKQRSFLRELRKQGFLLSRKEPGGQGSTQSSNINTRAGLIKVMPFNGDPTSNSTKRALRSDRGTSESAGREHWRSMDRSPYTMGKFALESKDILHSRQKGCWSYLKYFFLITSVIQSLIILGLVLFMVYGNPQVSTDSHLQTMEIKAADMQQRLKHLKDENRNLTLSYNDTARAVKFYRQLYEVASRNVSIINQSNLNLRAENIQLRNLVGRCQIAIATATRCNQQLSTMNITCYAEKLQLREEMNRMVLEHHILKENCSTTKDKLSRAAEDAIGDRERYHRQMIELRENKRALEDQLSTFKSSCSAIDGRFQTQLDHLQQSFDAAVRKALPNPASSPFELGSNPSLQSTQLSQNCHSLSDDVTKQVKDAVARINSEVTTTMSENSFLKVENGRGKSKLEECERSKETMLQDNKRAHDRLQANCDAEATLTYKEKESLKREKQELSKRMEENSQALLLAQMQLQAKTRELERCPKYPGSQPSSPYNPAMPFPGGNQQNFNDLNDQINRLMAQKANNQAMN